MAGDVHSGDVQSGDVRSGDVRSGDVRSAEKLLPGTRLEHKGDPGRQPPLAGQPVSSSWFLPAALAGDSTPEDADHPAPTRRAMILHRLGALPDSAALLPGAEAGALTAFAGALHAVLARRWGRQSLPFAPAFRTFTGR